MTKRTARAAVAQQTLLILGQGEYTAPSGRRVAIRNALADAVAGTRHYDPRETERLRVPPAATHKTAFEVTGETTLAAARRLTAAGERVLALNFASAKNPGGGFLNGSQAQEESLARASGLYACIAPHRAMYDANRRLGTCLYTDDLLYSPDVPVFRDDDDLLLEEPYFASFLTAPAVNAGVVRRQESGQIGPTMLRRMEKLLGVAAHHDHEVLVLGAWGCGVFRNDPGEVSRWFAQVLIDGPFRGVFRQVTFAVLDRGGDTLAAFQRAFAG